MYANGHSRANKMVFYPALGTERKRQETMRITLMMNGTWFDIKGVCKAASGVELHLTTDADSAELTIKSGEGDKAIPALRVFSNGAA